MSQLRAEFRGLQILAGVSDDIGVIGQLSTQWIRQFGSTRSDQTSDVAVDAEGNIYAFGDASEDFDGLGYQGGGDCWVAKYSLMAFFFSAQPLLLTA